MGAFHSLSFRKLPEMDWTACSWIYWKERTLKVWRNFRTFLTRNFRFSEIWQFPENNLSSFRIFRNIGFKRQIIANLVCCVFMDRNIVLLLRSINSPKRVTTHHIHGTNWSKRTFSYGTRQVIPSGGITCHIWPRHAMIKLHFGIISKIDFAAQ